MKGKRFGKVRDVELLGKHFTIEWVVEKCGVGRFTFYRKGKKLFIDNEFMGKSFIKKVLNVMVDNAILEEI